MSLLGLAEQLWMRDELGKISEAEEFKDLGNEAFKKQKYGEAVQHYTLAIDRNPLEPVFLVNRAAAYLQMKQFDACIQDCMQAINRRYTADLGTSSKAYYRLGVAQASLKEWDQAYDSLQSSLMCQHNPKVASKMSSVGKNCGQDPLLALNPVRRKLNDRGWSHFSLGNTSSVSTVRGLDLAALAAPARRAAAAAAAAAAEGGGGDAARLLYLGVGDVRNVLATLMDFLERNPTNEEEAIKKLHFHLNDIAPSTLARDVLLMLLAADGHFSAFVSIWANALLSPSEREILRQYLDTLLRLTEQNAAGLTAEYPWLFLNGNPLSIQKMRGMWYYWRHCTLTHKEIFAIRQKALGMKIPRHPRESQLWQSHGLGYFSEGVPEFPADLNAWPANPTLLDPVTMEFLEVQGPFQCFNGLHDGTEQLSQSLYNAWLPLMQSLRDALSPDSRISTQVHFWQGHCIQVMEKEMPRSLQFDVIDTSNLMDYFGLWNTVLPTVNKLREGSPTAFAQLQNVFGTGGSHLEVLQKHGLVRRPATYLALIGCRCEPVERVAGASTLLRFFLEAPGAAAAGAARPRPTAADAAETLAELFFCACNPIPLPVTSDPLRQPFQTGWFLQSQTPLTVAMTLERMARLHGARGGGGGNGGGGADLDDLENLEDFSYEAPDILPGLVPIVLSNQQFTNGLGARNRVLALCVALARRAGGPLAPALGELGPGLRELAAGLGVYRLRRFGFPLHEVRSQSLPLSLSVKGYDASDFPFIRAILNPFYDLGGLRGGIFEPSLAVALIDKKSTVEEGRKISGLTREGDTHHGVPFLQWIGYKSQSEVQIIDNVGFNVFSNELSFIFPGPDRAQPPNPAGGDPMSAMHWVVLLDIQRSEMIAEPVPLSAFDWKAL